MNDIKKRYVKLIIGLFVFAIGNVITINANLGYSPWDVFHQGIANLINIDIGTANIIAGLLIVVVGIFKGQKPGTGTLLNMFLIGVFINLLLKIDIIPVFSNISLRILSILLGMLIMAFGIYLYISAGFGAGPRDGLMVMLLKATGRSVSFIKNSIEITVLLVGLLMGGPLGIGTVMTSLGMGYMMQFVFKLFDFDPKAVIHRDWNDEINAFKGLFGKKIG